MTKDVRGLAFPSVKLQLGGNLLERILGIHCLVSQCLTASVLDVKCDFEAVCHSRPRFEALHIR